jgi:hypothetical protein
MTNAVPGSVQLQPSLLEKTLRAGAEANPGIGARRVSCDFGRESRNL